MPYYVRDQIAVRLTDAGTTAKLEAQDVTPGDYVVSCLMDTIGGGYIVGSGDLANPSAPAGTTASVAVQLNVAVP